MTEQVQAPPASIKKLLRGNLLQLAGFVSFAVAQPVYSLIAKYPEFLVAHSAKPAQIALFAVALLLLPFLLLGSLELLAAGLGKKVLGRVHLALLVLLFALVIQSPLSKIPVLGLAGSLLIASACAAAFGFAYAKQSVIRSFASLTALGVFIFPAFFLLAGPVAKLLKTAAPQQSFKVNLKSKPPIVVLLFDEFALRFLLDDNREIDEVRFPHFAALARDAVWCRNAVTHNTSTTYAVPSIVTGKIPDRKALPTVGDYPDNLFTLLNDQYSMNVREAVTNLCPEESRQQKKRTGRASTSVRALLADASVLYAYLLLPQNWTDWLPSIEGGWAGFAKPPVDLEEIHPGEELNDAVRSSLQTFLSEFDPSDTAALHFLHLLIPHTPLVFLPNGQFYVPNWRTPEGLGADKVWTHVEALVRLAEQRYLLQVGYVDKVLGQVIARIQEAGIYDETMIVVTSDHGIAFEPGFPYREASQSHPGAADLLAVPLFIKLPHQKKPRVVDGYTSTVDIMPTIADVLGIELPWEHDGRSVLAEVPEAIGELRSVWFHGANPGQESVFDWREIISLPFLDRQIAQFGERLPLEDLAPLGAYDPIMGKPTISVPFRALPAFKLQHDQAALLARPINPQSDFIPLYQSGMVTDPDGAAVAVAVAVDGVIRTVGPIHRGETAAEFHALLPQSALEAGQNRVELFGVSKTAAGTFELIAPRIEEPYRLQIVKDNTYEILKSDGTVIPMAEGSIRGALEPIDISGSPLICKGWAVDERAGRPAEEVLLFADGRYVLTLPVKHERASIVEWLGKPYRLSGFYEFVPPDLLANAEIAAFAVSDGRARELTYLTPDPQRPNNYTPARYHLFSGIRLEAESEGGPPRVVNAGGIPLGPNAKVGGALQSIQSQGEGLRLSGWYIDSIPPSEVRALLAFSGEAYLGSGSIAGSQPKLLQTLENNRASYEFSFWIPVADPLKHDSNGIQVVGLKTGGALGPLSADAVPPSAATAQAGLPQLRGFNIAPGAIRGAIEIPKRHGEDLLISGWAIVEPELKSADLVIILADGEVVAKSEIGLERKDIADWLGDPFLKSGFVAKVPEERLRGKEISAYGIGADRMSELGYVYLDENQSVKIRSDRYRIREVP